MNVRCALVLGLLLAVIAGRAYWQTNSRLRWKRVLSVVCMGAAVGVGLGLPLGAAFDTRPRPADRPLKLSRVPEAEAGFSRLDVLVAGSGTLVSTVLALSLASAALGERELLRLAGELSPLAATGPWAALASLVCTLVVGSLLPQLALAALRPPRRHLTLRAGLLVGGAGYLVGLASPPLALVLLLG